MAKTSSWTFVTPKYVVARKIKGFKTASQVKTFAKKNDVYCGYMQNSSGTGRQFLVEISSFKKAVQTTGTAIVKTAGTKKTTKTHAKKASIKKITSKWVKAAKSIAKTGNKNWARTYTKRRAA